MGRRDFFEQEKKKKMVTTFTIAIVLSVIACVTIFVMYNEKLDNQAETDLLAVTEKNDIVANDDIQETSYTKDKTIEDANSIKVELPSTVENTVVKTPESKEPVTSVIKEKNEVKETKQEKVENEVKTENETTTPDNTESTKELCFQAPVAGEITKDYAMDTLVYSETLDEWCTHTGIDIKADKSSIVVASEAGKIESIKNDPRYGLTIIISHDNGFKTVYSNLLTTEFVKEGEEVEKGQTIATVGESASFEIADDSHLHFEMYKDGITVNPTIYFK